MQKGGRFYATWVLDIPLVNHRIIRSPLLENMKLSAGTGWDWKSVLHYV